MAKYWIYINQQVMGPYELDQLIRVPGFSRQTPVSVDDYTGKAGKWISPADIPELVRIFQKVDELHDAPVPAARPAAKPRPKIPTRLTAVAPPVEEPKKWPWVWLWVVLFSLVAAGSIFHWSQREKHKSLGEERQTAQSMIETAPLPASSQYASLRHYLEEKQISSRWEFERTSTGLYHVTVSWSPPDNPGARLAVYAFEANLQARTLRGLNTAAIRLLAEGFPRPASKPAAAAAAPAKPKKSPGDMFPGAINERRQAFEQGDFESVWDAFSRRRKNEMEQGGISAAGFSKMQKLTYRPGSQLQQTILKTQEESDTVRLVLLRQSQPKHPDIFVKQRWVWEDNEWCLDDEEKRAAAVPAAAASDAPPPAAKPVPMNLPRTFRSLEINPFLPPRRIEYSVSEDI